MASERKALIRAALVGDLEVFKGLLQPEPSTSLPKADFTLEKLAGIAARNHHPEILNFCIAIGANVNDDLVRIGVLEANSLTIYQTAIAAGFELNYGHHVIIGGPLILATSTDDISLAKYLLNHGADVNRDLQGGVYRPLAKAAEKNSIGMIELFLKHGAQIDRSGALIVAAAYGNLDAVRCLLSHGANIDLISLNDTDLYTMTHEQDSALHKAVRGGHEDVVVCLVESGAQLGLRDHQGRDALMVSVEMNNAEVFQIIYDARKKLEGDRYVEI